MGLLLSGCPLGSSGTQGVGTPGAPTSITDSSGPGPSGFPDSSRASGGPDVAADSQTADSQKGPHAPMGDSEGIHCGEAEPSRVYYGSNLSMKVDKTTDPFPTLDLGANGQWDLQFLVETQVVECGIKSYWVAHHPGMKVRFIQDPDNSRSARSECDVLLDPPNIDPTMMPENDFHQLSVSAVSGKLSMYYDLDWAHVGGPDCSNHVLAPITDQQYNEATMTATPLGSFNLHLPATSSASPSNQTQTRVPSP